MAAGSGAITGFPTIWAQNIKDVTLTHVGQSFSVIPQIGQQASKDLGFKIDMQTVDYATQLNRLFTQPDSIDIADLSINVVPDIMKQDRVADPGVKVQVVGQDDAALHAGRVSRR